MPDAMPPAPAALSTRAGRRHRSPPAGGRRLSAALARGGRCGPLLVPRQRRGPGDARAAAAAEAAAHDDRPGGRDLGQVGEEGGAGTGGKGAREGGVEGVVGRVEDGAVGRVGRVEPASVAEEPVAGDAADRGGAGFGLAVCGNVWIHVVT